MDPQLQLLIDLQALDTRIAALEAEGVRLPKQIQAIQEGLSDARKLVEGLKARLETTKKDIRFKEKDLDVSSAKRSKAETRLYEVKTNKEYSAVLAEIEEIKQEKARLEEEILALMETQERLASDVREADAQLKAREREGAQEEATVREQLRAVESELEVVRAERRSLAAQVPAALLASYEKILKARGGLAMAQALPAPICAGCRMSIRPQAMQEIRAQSQLITCESCGRYLYWPDPA